MNSEVFDSVIAIYQEALDRAYDEMFWMGIGAFSIGLLCGIGLAYLQKWYDKKQQAQIDAAVQKALADKKPDQQ